MFVSVLLVKGRTNAPPPADARDAAGPPRRTNDTSDPGKPSFRLGYVELKVEDASKRLTVAVRAEQGRVPAGERREGQRSTSRIAQGRGAPSEVTLWAVDYGVLSLTALPHARRPRLGLRRRRRCRS